MERIINWDKPTKAETTEEWKKRSADGAPPGVYSPNMSHESMLEWKGKKIGGKDPRVEVRKSNNGAQMLLVIRKDTVQFSSNGRIILDTEELNTAISEAQGEL